MSHQKERVEKNCLNCNAEVQGRFCQVCGQENIETKESFKIQVMVRNKERYLNQYSMGEISILCDVFKAQLKRIV